MIVEQQPCKVPDDPILNFIDFMGRYTILLNGTVLQKEATKGELQDLADEHKKEVIDKFKRLWESRPIANNGVSLSFNEKELTKIGYDAVRDYSWEVSGLDALNFPICNVCELHKVVKIVVKGILAKLQPTAPVTASR